jgi:DNA-binding YbaB/EbfC family protein
VTEGFDPQALLAQALEMQQRLLDAQAEAEDAIVEGASGGGKVTVTMTGTGEVTAVHIDPSVVDPAEVDLLEDLIVAALRDAATRVGLLAEQRLGEGFGGGLGDLFGGLPGLGAPGGDDAGDGDPGPEATGDGRTGDEERG